MPNGWMPFNPPKMTERVITCQKNKFASREVNPKLASICTRWAGLKALGVEGLSVDHRTRVINGVIQEGLRTSLPDLWKETNDDLRKAEVVDADLGIYMNVFVYTDREMGREMVYMPIPIKGFGFSHVKKEKRGGPYVPLRSHYLQALLAIKLLKSTGQDVCGAVLEYVDYANDFATIPPTKIVRIIWDEENRAMMWDCATFLNQIYNIRQKISKGKWPDPSIRSGEEFICKKCPFRRKCDFGRETTSKNGKKGNGESPFDEFFAGKNELRGEQLPMALGTTSSCGECGNPLEHVRLNPNTVAIRCHECGFSNETLLPEK